jgi:murein L,D-transpeptidase YafK
LRRTGSFLMVHGGCSSVGCFAMTDPAINEIWQMVTAALAGGQKRFHVHVFPFRMTDEAMSAVKSHAAAAFWTTLKPAHDMFNASQQVPEISVCGRTYEVAAGRPRNALTAESRIGSTCRADVGDARG